MKIVHAVGRSLVRFTPARIACLWGRYTKHESTAIAVCRGSPGNVGWHFQEPINPYGFLCARRLPKGGIKDILRKADVIHCHDDIYPPMLLEKYHIPRKGKVLIYHAHIGDIPIRYFRSNVFLWDEDVKHCCITNGYGHLFDEYVNWEKKSHWFRLPDVIDIHHPVFWRRSDSFRMKGRLHAVFTVSNCREGNKINAKKPRAHRKIFDRIPGVSLRLVRNVSFEESVAEKRVADIVIEEIFSPYLHLSALEGAAVGTPVVTNWTKETEEEVCGSLGIAEPLPFIRVDEDTIVRTLSKIVRSRKHLASAGEKQYQWMRKWYDPERLLGLYESLYRL